MSTGRWWVDWPVAFAAALGAYQFIVRKGVLPMLTGLRKLAKNAEAMVHSAETIPAMDDRLKHVEAQLTVNGGTSLRDAVNRIERAQSQVRTELLVHRKKLGIEMPGDEAE